MLKIAFARRNICWGIAFTVGGYAGSPELSPRYVAILLITAIVCTVIEELA